MLSFLIRWLKTELKNANIHDFKAHLLVKETQEKYEIISYIR
jgi:hypothetical protein